MTERYRRDSVTGRLYDPETGKLVDELNINSVDGRALRPPIARNPGGSAALRPALPPNDGGNRALRPGLPDPQRNERKDLNDKIDTEGAPTVTVPPGGLDT